GRGAGGQTAQATKNPQLRSHRAFSSRGNPVVCSPGGGNGAPARGQGFSLALLTSFFIDATRQCVYSDKMAACNLRTIRILMSKVFLLAALCIGGAALGGPLQQLQGHVPAVVAGLQPTGELPKTQKLSLSIGLPLRNPAALDALLQQLYDPASPQYHQFLTPAQFTAQFGPTESDYQAVAAFALSNHLAVVRTHSNRALLD